jgi:hypothetical protein
MGSDQTNWDILSSLIEKTFWDSFERTVETRAEVLRFQMASLVPDLLKKLKLRGGEEMIHKHGYITLKPMPVYLPAGQKLCFLLPAISVTSGKIQMFFPIHNLKKAEGLSNSYLY